MKRLSNPERVTPINTTSYAELDDHALVTRSRTGDVEAFREIASRYLPLINALTYCLTGSLTRGKDLARDTFVVAWKQMPALSARVELHLWLCGIALKLVADFLGRIRAN